MDAITQNTLEERTFKLMGKVDLPLYVSPSQSFLPNSTTRLLTKVMLKTMKENDVVFDIGAGVGPLAIWAAKKGASDVYAVEIVDQQYELIQENLVRNGVEKLVNAYCGNLYDPIPEGVKADLIVASVSAVADGPAQIWYSLDVPNGGEDGTDNIVPALEQAKHYMKDNATVIFPLLVGIADSDKIMAVAKSCFNDIELMLEIPIPLKDENLQRFNDTRRGRDYLKLVEHDNHQCWIGQIYTAKLPK